MKAEETISRMVQESMPNLAPRLREWAEAHLVPPTKQIFAMDTDGRSEKEFWLITDHNGTNDSGYRVVFDDEKQLFGLETTLQNKIAWYMGLYGSFQEAVENM